MQGLMLVWRNPVAWLVLGLLVAAPAVQACSMSRVPPQPAAFFLWDGEGYPTVVTLRDRSLGAMCDLDNLHAIGDGHFVFVTHHGPGIRLHVVNTTSGDRWNHDIPVEGSVFALGVEGPTAWVVVGRSVDRTLQTESLRIDLVHGRVESLPEAPSSYHIILDGRFAVAEPWRGPVSLMDLEDGRTVAGPLDVDGQVLAANRDHLLVQVFDPDTATRQVRLQDWTGEVLAQRDGANMGGSTEPALDGGDVVWGTWRDGPVLMRWTPGEDDVEIGRPGAAFTGAVHDGLYVFGSYSGPQLESAWRVPADWWPPRLPISYPVGVVPLVLVGLGMAAWLRRLRRE